MLLQQPDKTSILPDEVSMMNKKNTISKYLALFALTLIAMLPSELLAADEYQIDPVHSSVLFRIKHLAISNVYGKFIDFKGTLIIDQKEYIAEQGDNLYFDSSIPHSWENPWSDTVEGIWVCSPPVV